MNTTMVLVMQLHYTKITITIDLVVLHYIKITTTLELVVLLQYTKIISTIEISSMTTLY